MTEREVRVRPGLLDGPRMELRDWFAGMALSGIIAEQTVDVVMALNQSANELASFCYWVADAMVEARGRVEQP